MKFCNKCQTEKDESEFNKDKSKKDGLHSHCKSCKAEYAKKRQVEKREQLAEYKREYYQKNKEEIILKRKQYNEDHKEENAMRGKRYRKNNKEHVALYHKQYANDNREKIAEYKKQYSAKNYEKAAESKRNYYIRNRDLCIERSKQNSIKNKDKNRIRDKNRYNNDVQYRIANNLRSRIYKAVKNGRKSGSAIRDLGCSVTECKIHLEKQFLPGMTWDNWGKGEGKWQIDHIMPLSKFDLTNREEFLRACHYTNLQPLWAKDNLAKGNKILVEEKYGQ